MNDRIAPLRGGHHRAVVKKIRLNELDRLIRNSRVIAPRLDHRPDSVASTDELPDKIATEKTVSAGQQHSHRVSRPW